MEHFTAHILSFRCEAQTTIRLPRYNGSILRGAFFGALRRDFCLNKNLNSCLACPAAEVCPICRLVATVERDNERGAEVPRPFSLQPVISRETLFQPGQCFNFGITLYGDSLSLFPYAILAIQRMGEIGFGSREGPGCFILKEARAVNPLTGAEKLIFNHETRTVNVPDLAVTHQEVVGYAGRLNSEKISLELLTPLRLIVEGVLVQHLNFRFFMQRLLRRLTDLYHYSCHEELELDFAGLLRQAEGVQVIKDSTAWVDLSSYSNRRGARTPTGGLVGEISLAGDFSDFLLLLVWGQITHVGKDATRGNGWYMVRSD